MRRRLVSPSRASDALRRGLVRDRQESRRGPPRECAEAAGNPTTTSLTRIHSNAMPSPQFGHGAAKPRRIARPASPKSGEARSQSNSTPNHCDHQYENDAAPRTTGRDIVDNWNGSELHDEHGSFNQPHPIGRTRAPVIHAVCDKHPTVIGGTVRPSLNARRHVEAQRSFAQAPGVAVRYSLCFAANINATAEAIPR